MLADAGAAPAEFGVERLGQIMSPSEDPREAWGVLNPAGVRGPDGEMHLFPRVVAEGNYSRIAHAQVMFAGGTPVSASRLGIALEPHESYEVSALGGGVEDPRVTYVAALGLFVMTYTAYVPFEPRVALAISTDLFRWRRLGLVRYALEPGIADLNRTGNKDAALFPGVVSDRDGVPSLALLHRPTTRIAFHHGGCDVTKPPCGEETREHVWISYISLADGERDPMNLVAVAKHEKVMAPAQPWEREKVGAGSPPLRLPDGWLLLYHAVSRDGERPRYCIGAALLDLERPSHVLWRTPQPIMVPETEYERNGHVSNVIFPTATDMRPDGRVDVYYGAADRVIAVARLTVGRPRMTRDFPSLERTF